MALLTLTFPPGTVAAVSKSSGDWYVDSVNTTDVVIIVDDADNDGTISDDEWDAAVSGNGNDIGDAGFLYQGGGTSGFLYATNGTTTFTVGEDVTDIRHNMSNHFEADVSAVVCFVKGTRIATPEGHQLIETLHEGDKVLTANGEAHRVRWIGRREVSAFELLHAPKLCPVRIRAGALGNQLPVRDLLVSRQHRILIKSKVAERMFGTNEVLIPAVKLIECSGIDIDDRPRPIEYFHILLDRHEILLANGAPAESLFTGPEAMKSLSPEAIDEINTLFPEILERISNQGPAALVPSNKRVNRMLKRHKKNNKALACV
ncbi:Hint domain-containing protein [Aliiroseovarius sp. F20344]|uniref:Hint domain-containing protein n=1 Tax=Aliiroseovarius sp. F20344 TaxID=2926414 RepID=UPI001FF5C29E|nr:Hint domain-containing protein [Aliiroseovarius sp. F20344]MCK0141534.1 Hint domain-containing protein [Aliiroseovarius sp. F20344]